MSALFPDTHPDAEAVLIRMLREAPPWSKLEMVVLLNESVRLLAQTGLRQRLPEENDDQIRTRLADLLIEEELAVKVYGTLLELG
jgi:hypothetical protein